MGGSHCFDTARIEELAQLADPEADAVIAELLETSSLSSVQTMLNTLTRNREDVPSELPEVVKRYFENMPVSDEELRISKSGELFFAQYGPEIMMVLCCSSLPFDYCNARGVEVLTRTGFLAKHPNLRVAQTAQMIVDVLTPGGLSPQGHGVRSAQKVRLMHAAIRCMLLSDVVTPWDRSTLGVPISQLQLLYTLMSFSHVVLVGLERLGLRIAPEDQQAYLEVWGLVGRLMGIQADIIPKTVAEAAELTDRLALQAQGSTPAGEQLTLALASLIGEVLGPFSVLRTSLIRYFTGSSVANMLGLPSKPVLDWAVSAIAWVVRMVDRIRRESKDHQIVFRWLTLHLIQFLIDNQLGSTRRLFQIPTQVQEDWKRQAKGAQP
jgi:hypothetical protein